MESFKTQDAASYDHVAASFARFTDIVTTSLADTAVRMADLRPSNRILDVGTGSGIVGLAAASSVKGGLVAGLDLSDGLLAEARNKRDTAGMRRRFHLTRGDAESLPYRDAAFDRVLSLFALLHFPHPAVALKEMVRVLKPGGRLVIGLGSRPPWTSLNGWRNRVGRAAGILRLWSGRLLVAPAHLDAIVARHIPPSGLEETELAQLGGHRAAQALSLFRQAGLADIDTAWEGRHLVVDDANDFWELQRTFSSMSRKRLQSATASQLASVREEFDRDCARVLSNGGQLAYHYAAYFLAGRRP